MDKTELLKTMDAAYKDIQFLDLKPTKTNITILANVLEVLEKAYGYLQSTPDIQEAGKDAAE